MEELTLWEKINQFASDMPLGVCLLCGAVAVLIVTIIVKKWIAD